MPYKNKWFEIRRRGIGISVRSLNIIGSISFYSLLIVSMGWFVDRKFPVEFLEIETKYYLLFGGIAILLILYGLIFKSDYSDF